MNLFHYIAIKHSVTEVCAQRTEDVNETGVAVHDTVPGTEGRRELEEDGASNPRFGTGNLPITNQGDDLLEIEQFNPRPS
jgi:hypothetical protein